MCFFPFPADISGKLYLAPLTTVGPTAGWEGQCAHHYSTHCSSALGAWVHIWGPSLPCSLRVPSTVPSGNLPSSAGSVSASGGRDLREMAVCTNLAAG